MKFFKVCITGIREKDVLLLVMLLFSFPTLPVVARLVLLTTDEVLRPLG